MALGADCVPPRPGAGLFFVLEHQIAVGYTVSLGHVDGMHDALPRGADDIVHLHGLDHQQLVPGADALARPHGDRLDDAGQRSDDYPA